MFVRVNVLAKPAHTHHQFHFHTLEILTQQHVGHFLTKKQVTLQQLLMAYRNGQCDATQPLLFGKEIASGMPNASIASIVKNAHNINSPQCLSNLGISSDTQSRQSYSNPCFECSSLHYDNMCNACILVLIMLLCNINNDVIGDNVILGRIAA